MSSIDPNTESIGYEAAQLLDQMMSQGKKAKDTKGITLSPRGVVTRRSTAASPVCSPVAVTRTTTLLPRLMLPLETAGITPRYLESMASGTLLLGDLPASDAQSWYADKMIVLDPAKDDATLAAEFEGLFGESA